MKRWIYFIILILILISVAWILEPWNVFIENKHDAIVNEVNSATNWEVLHEVEDSCRAMISNYQADCLIYEQYKDSEDREQKNWASQAQMRANKTAAQYNEYILKNNYVWKYGIPDDIKETLDYIK